MASTYEQVYRCGGSEAIREAQRFLMGEDAVHDSLHRITRRLTELDIAYCVVGGMALVAHGYNRTTVDVDLLVTPDGLERVHAALDGLGYLPPFAGSKHLRDTTTGVRIEFLTTGGYPGDGKPKPVRFPDPADVAVEIDGVRYLALPKLIELKLASGMSNITRAKDIGDVVALIQELQLPRAVADSLEPSVRAKFLELWDAVAAE